jgi:hypothetical protein
MQIAECQDRNRRDGEAGAFGDPEQWRYEWEWPYTRGEWLDQVPTFGGYTARAGTA